MVGDSFTGGGVDGKGGGVDARGAQDWSTLSSQLLSKIFSSGLFEIPFCCCVGGDGALFLLGLGGCVTGRGGGVERRCSSMTGMGVEAARVGSEGDRVVVGTEEAGREFVEVLVPRGDNSIG